MSDNEFPYDSPNIVVVPTMSFSEAPSQKPVSKVDKNDSAKNSKSIPILIRGTTSDFDKDMHSNCNKTGKNQSWASNYLQSIGLSYDKTILKRRSKMNSCQDNPNNILTEDPSATTVADINMTNNTPNINCNDACNVSNGTVENNSICSNYNHIAAALSIGMTMPTTTYGNSYGNTDNNYYYHQPMNILENSGPPITYYSSATAPVSMANVNIPATYSAFGQPTNVYGNNLYFNTSGTAHFANVNLPEIYSNTYLHQRNNDVYGQTNFVENSIFPTNLFGANTTPATVIDTNSAPILNLSRAVDSKNTEEEIKQQMPLKSSEKKICCNCSCSKLKPDENQNKQENNKDTKFKQKSTVIENEKKFQNFLQRLNNTQSEKNHSIISEKPTSDTEKLRIILKQKEDTPPKFIKTKYVDEQEPEYNPTIKRARIDNGYEIKKYTKHDHGTVKKENTYGKSGSLINKTSKRISKEDYNSKYKIKESITESKKYRKYKHAREEKMSPIKSVVRLSEKRDCIKPIHHRNPENRDLRNRLSRKLNKKESILEIKKLLPKICKHDSPDKISDNLTITVNNNTSEIKKSPEKAIERNKNESQKKINLVINIIYKQPNSQSESDKSDSDDHNQQLNPDLSFLDDFNVDEIVESLNKSEKNTIKTSLSAGTSISKIESEKSKAIVKEEHPDKAEMPLHKADILNNLFLKEASLLDSLRMIHQEIENEKQHLGGSLNQTANQPFENVKYEFSQKENEYFPNEVLDANGNTISQPINESLLDREFENGSRCPTDMNKTNTLEILRHQSIPFKDENLAIIDLSNEDSNDNVEQSEIKTTKKTQALNDDCTVTEHICLVDTIDLTIDETAAKSDAAVIRASSLLENESYATKDDDNLLTENCLKTGIPTDMNQELLNKEEVQLSTDFSVYTCPDSLENGVKVNDSIVSCIEVEAQNVSVKEKGTNAMPKDKSAIVKNVNNEQAPNSPRENIAFAKSDNAYFDKEKNNDNNSNSHVNSDESDHVSNPLNIVNNIDVQAVPENQILSLRDQQDVGSEPNGLSISKKNKSSVSDTSKKEILNETNINKMVITDKDIYTDLNILGEKADTQITDTKAGIKDTKEKEIDVESNDTSKVVSSNTKLTASSKKTHCPSSKQKKDETCAKKSVKNNKLMTPTKAAQIASKLECVMLQCFDKEYSGMALIHAGSHSKIFHCRNNGRDYAVKSYNSLQSIYKYAETKDMLFALQRGIKRRNYAGVFLLNSFSLNTHLCLLMDYYPKNLRQALKENGKPFHITEVQYMCRQLVSAMMFLKSNDLVHLDIKPEHVLLNHTNSKLKLCGFETVCLVNQIPPSNNIGTLNYRPPEVIIGYKLGFDVDVWATGLVLYEMATNITLFPGTYDNDILYKQMCTLGPLPIEMLHRSLFVTNHFTGSNFRRIRSKKFSIITKFQRSSRLETTITQAYMKHWRPISSPCATRLNMLKIMLFTSLLKEMLEVNPGDRMPIQFVNAHPFLTNESY